MADQKYKLVPVEPTREMFRAIYHRLPTLALNVKEVHEALCAAIAAAPEPVCRWEYFTGLGYNPQCVDPAGHKSALRQKYSDDAFCPHCRKKVEVVDNE